MDMCMPICRVCMQKSLEYVDFDMPLQNENEEDTSITYLDFFFECTRIEVEPHDGGSQCFCLPCGDELRSFYKFIKIAEMTDRILRENSMVKLKNHRKSDSTFETVAWEPEFEDDYLLEEELLHEDVEGSIDNEESKDQSVYPNGHSDIKETVAHQFLLDLQVEIFRTKAPVSDSVDNTLDTSDDCKKNSRELTTRSDTSNDDKQEDEKDKQVNPTGKKYKKGPVECAFCHEILKNRKCLDKHLLEDHQTRTQPCEICGKMVIRMRDHLLIHYREKNDISRPKVECPICLRKVSKQTISRHIRYVHKREVKNQKCPECSQTFPDAYKLKVHMAKGHTPDRSLKCPLCPRMFSHTISLNNHLRTHPCLERKSHEKVFACDKCPMSFGVKKQLDYHKRVHTSVEFDCQICDQRFSGTGGLRRHLQLHRGGKFPCGDCSQTFISRTELDVHIHSHSLCIKFPKSFIQA